MIVKNLGTHYEIEMFNVIVVNKDDPQKSWLSYIEDITKEFIKEVTRSQYPSLGLQPVQSHIVVPDKDEGEKGILDAISKKYNYV
jgi:hypothetical protein